MSSFLRAVASVFVTGMIVGAGVLMLLPGEAKIPVAAHVPDPPAQPCKRQAWANADRGCLAWTSPQGELALAAELAAVRPVADAQPVQAPAVKAAAAVDAATPAVAPPISAVAPVAALDRSASPASRGKTEPRRVRNAALSSMAIVANVKGRSVVIRPTSQQDLYYYAARGRLAAAGAPVQR